MTPDDCAADLVSVKQSMGALKRVFDLKIGEIEKDMTGAQFIMRAPTAGVRVALSDRDETGLDVVVARLVNGGFPQHPITIDDNTVLHGFDIRDLASLRLNRLSETLQKKINEDKALTAQDVKKLLEKCCDDVLNGDFSVFDAASRLVKDRAKRLAEEYPTK